MLTEEKRYCTYCGCRFEGEIRACPECGAKEVYIKTIGTDDVLY